MCRCSFCFTCFVAWCVVKVDKYHDFLRTHLLLVCIQFVQNKAPMADDINNNNNNNKKSKKRKAKVSDSSLRSLTSLIFRTRRERRRKQLHKSINKPN